MAGIFFTTMPPGKPYHSVITSKELNRLKVNNSYCTHKRGKDTGQNTAPPRPERMTVENLVDHSLVDQTQEWKSHENQDKTRKTRTVIEFLAVRCRQL